MEAAKIEAQYVLLKGEPGTRKSTQALSYPKPQFWFSWDQKMNSLLVPMRAWGINPSEITYEDYNDWDKPKKKLEQLQIDCKYKTIIIDSITSMADCTLRQSMKFKGDGSRGKKVGTIQTNEVEDFNAEAAAITELIALTKDIHKYHKVNIILIAHVIKADYKQLNGPTTFSRTIVTAAKKIAAKIPAYCEEVYHFDVAGSMDTSKGGEYCCYTENVGEDFARTQLNLDKKIQFGNKELYKEYIKPAIDKINAPFSQVSK